MVKGSLVKKEEELFELEDIPVAAPDDVFAYNEIRSCADLKRMYDDKIIDTAPEFQRDFVWSKADKTRFIDSILKSLPIPSMCFSYDPKQQKWIVIDGLQRISTIISFLRGDNWQFSQLEDIDKRIAGKQVQEILENPQYRDIRTKIENYSLPLTVVRCDYNKKDHMAYIFTVFHRLNSTGVRLSNQEIRNCIFSGNFSELLRELDQFSDWRKLNKMQNGNNYRMKKQELILRFFAYRDSLSMYKDSLSGFLNDYMHENRNLSKEDMKEKGSLFRRSVSLLLRAINIIEKHRLSMVVQDALLYGISYSIDGLERLSDNELRQMLDRILSSDIFSQENMSEGLARGNKVRERLDYVKDEMATVC